MIHGAGHTAVAWVLASMLLVAACGDAGAPKSLASARDFLARDDPAAALVELRNAARSDPDLAEVRYLMGIALLRTADPAGAALALEKALALGFDRNLVVPALADARYRTGAHEKALKTLDAEPVDLSAARATAEAIRGDALAAMGRPDAARKAYEAALRIDPKQARARLGQASMAADGGDFARAEAILAETFGSDPTSGPAWFLKGAIADRRGQTDAAIAGYEKTLALTPDSLPAYVALIPHLVARHRLPDAEVRLAALARLAPASSATAYAEAVVTYAKGDTARARSAIQAVLKYAPDDNRARLLGGMVEHELGNYAMAEKLLTAVVKTSPGPSGARHMLASTLLRAGKAQEARQAIDPMLTAPAPAAATLELAGDIALRLGNTTQAVAHFGRAITLDPKRPGPLIGRARARLAAGQFEPGIADLGAASLLDPSQPAADVLAIEALLQKGLTDRAQAVADALVKRLPAQAAAHDALGLVARGRGDAKGARAAFAKAVGLAPTFLPAVKHLVAVEMEAGNTAGAIETLRALVKRDPGRPEAVSMLVAALQRTGAPADEVLPVIDLALRENVLALPLFLVKTDYLLGRGDTQGALDAALAGLAAFPGEPRALLSVARTQLRSGDSRQALANFGKLAALEPRAAAPLLGMAEAHAAERHWPEARAALQRAIALAPDDPAAYLGRVKVSHAAGDPAQARDDARVIAKKWPARPEGWLHEAAALDRLKQRGSAELVLRNGLAAGGASEVLGALYQHLLADGKAAEAGKVLTAWLARHPGDARGMFAAGEVHQRRGELEEAERWFRRALEVRADDPVALNNLAFVLGSRGDRSALDFGRRALAAAPYAAAVLDTVGVLNVQFGNRDEGIRQLESAVARSPADTPIRVHLARALIAAGRKPDARHHLEEASRLDPDDESAAAIATLMRDL